MVGEGLLGIFLPIFLYLLFDGDLFAVALYYGIGYFSYLFFLFFGTRFLNAFGFRRALRTSVFLAAAYFAIFYFVDADNWRYLLPLALVLIGVYRLFYWLPYHIDFAKFTSKADRGKELSAIAITRNVLGAILPVVGGFVAFKFGFDALFFVAIIVYLLSGIPYLTLPHTREKFRWGYKKTLQEFFNPRRKGVILAFFGFGIQSTVGIIVWPIFIFKLLNANLLEVGGISTLIVITAVLLQYLVGKNIDDRPGEKNRILRTGSLLYSLGWILKIFVITAGHIFVVGAYHQIVDIFTRTPFQALKYEMAADQGHYVDEFTVIYEMALQLGKIFGIAGIIIISFYLPIQWTFILAAGASIMLNFIWTTGYAAHPEEFARVEATH